MSRPGTAGGRPGLTLLEVLVALAIFLLSLAAITRLVTFAAHCQLAGTVRAIYFGENASSPSRKVDVASCNFYPNYKANVNDVAYCVLAEEVNDVPLAPLLMGCETSVLQKRARSVAKGM